jgi:hypothetical protein
MSTRIVGASVWEQDLYDHLAEHVESEQAIVSRYRNAAQHSESPAFAFLAGLILEDEQRHHRLMQDLAESLRRFAELAGEPEPIPALDRPADRAALAELTSELLAVEKSDRREITRLRKEIEAGGVRTLWPLILQLVELDTDKHIRILEFARQWLREEY